MPIAACAPSWTLSRHTARFACRRGPQAQMSLNVHVRVQLY